MSEMRWEAVEKAEIDDDAYYVVRHNGREWRDFDIAVWRGLQVRYRLRPDYVRGRPEWIAKLTDPRS